MERRQQDLYELASRLRDNNRRVTGPRQLILDLLRREKHPVSAREIHERLSEPCNLATVYRSMRLLESMQMVKRFDFGDGSARYELLGRDDDGHHHHLICHECRKVVEINDCFPHTLEKHICTTLVTLRIILNSLESVRPVNPREQKYPSATLHVARHS